MSIRNDANIIMNAAIQAALPETAVRKALADADFPGGRLVLVAIGKAAWTMARAASELLGDRIDDGVVITKYDHAPQALPRLRIYEAGHPFPDSNSYAATEEAIRLVSGLDRDDAVLFLISGGGSALFEKPLVSPELYDHVNRQLLESGANIVEINTIRKRLSAVKGGKFARLCEPARVYSIVLSDILGDPLDMIASGPAYPDQSTTEQALTILTRYSLDVPDEVRTLLREEPVRELRNVKTQVMGSVRQLCLAAEEACRKLGYEPFTLTASLSCEAREAGRFLASIAQYHAGSGRPLAFLAGGETVVHVTGRGKGGRSQELALAAAPDLAGLRNTAVFSFGSDGTDGPTDAAGGYVDGRTAGHLAELGIDIASVLQQNDSYHALELSGGLLKTGPTGTNVNDLSVLLIRP